MSIIFLTDITWKLYHFFSERVVTVVPVQLHLCYLVLSFCYTYSCYHWVIIHMDNMVETCYYIRGREALSLILVYGNLVCWNNTLFVENNVIWKLSFLTRVMIFISLCSQFYVFWFCKWMVTKELHTTLYAVMSCQRQWENKCLFNGKTCFCPVGSPPIQFTMNVKNLCSSYALSCIDVPKVASSSLDFSLGYE